MRSSVGLSIVELLVALTLLSVGALATAGSTGAAIRAAREGRSARADAAIAREALEGQVARGCGPATTSLLLAEPFARGRHRGATLFAIRTC